MDKKKTLTKEKVLKVGKRILICIGALILAGIIAIVGINLLVIATTSGRILSIEEASKEDKVDCIIVLGAAVRPDGTPSAMLRDRLEKAVELYEAGVSDTIIVSGDHREDNYDEVNTMKYFLMDAGIPSEDIFMDHGGLSTYDTMYRAVNVFGVKKAVVVTQKYHMYRALYIAKSLGIDAYGVNAKEVSYSGQAKRDIREVLARIKDVGLSITKPESEVTGGKISLSGSGDITNDK
ncbi:MAG: ElyC/SanA/YdcF family protein [Lachnospiraceae bacterium]|nr:ElyC/SanA/YdcF family protein [Lachnospiraceae bacterium]